jgi:hypothetical protein
MGMSYFMVDVESDGPIPGDYSMISIGCVVVEEPLTKTFAAKLRPISENYKPDALAVSGMKREETLLGEDPKQVMARYASWIGQNANGRPIFVSDNNGYDWMFVCWYFHHFLGTNPFGYSSVNLGNLYKGMVKSMARSFKHLRKTSHTHDPLDDAIGNAEALLTMVHELGLQIQ